MADKADWCDGNMNHFFAICKEEMDAGNRPLGQFNSNGWKNLISKYEERTHLKQTKKQMKNKLDNMKKENTWFMEFKNAATGLGWNEIKKTVECSEEWWAERLARCNNPEKGTKCNHVRFRKQGPKHLDDLHLLFDKTHVTGPSASCPDNISSNESSDEDVDELPNNDHVKLAALKKPKPGKKKRNESSTATEEKEEKSPFFRLYKNTCKRIETAAEKISISGEASSAAPTNQVTTIKEAM